VPTYRTGNNAYCIQSIGAAGGTGVAVANTAGAIFGLQRQDLAYDRSTLERTYRDFTFDHARYLGEQAIPPAVGEANGTAAFTGAAVGLSPVFRVTQRHSGDNNTVNSQTLTTSSATPTAQSLLLAFYGVENANHTTAPTLSAPSGGGLTFTLVDKIGDSVSIPWGGSFEEFRAASACYSATVGASPSAHTLTIDGYAGTELGYYAAASIDITGHYAGSPIVQSKVTGATKGGGDAESGTVVLDSAPTAGNLLVVAIFAGADSGTLFAAPTAGPGKTMVEQWNPVNTGATHIGIWTRYCDGTESTTITCDDLGDAVGNYTAHAIEISGPVVGGEGAGVFTWVGTASGSTTRSGGASGSLAYAGNATGSAPSRGTASGVLAFSGVALGQATTQGVGSGSWSFAGAAVGTSSRSGTATGAAAFDGTATGTTQKRGTAVGGLTYTGTATGSTVKAGTATGSVVWAGEAAGTTTKHGTSSGLTTWAGTAVGTAPAVGAQEGSGSGSWVYTGTAVGQTTKRGTGAGEWLYTGAANGTAPAPSTPGQGVASGTWHYTGTASSGSDRDVRVLGITEHPRVVTITEHRRALTVTDRSLRAVETDDETRTVTASDRSRTVTVLERTL
jgi:hypothetical protein